jgi:Transposase IS200 like
MLTFTETTMRTVLDELDVELVEFNGETDHVHLLVAYPPTLAISVPVQRLKGRAPLTPSAASSPARVSAPACADTSGRRPTSPSPVAVPRCRSSSKTSTAKPDHSERRAPPGDTRDGLTPARTPRLAPKNLGQDRAGRQGRGAPVVGAPRV